MKEESYEELKQQRDALLSIEGQAQKREAHLQRAIDLLLVAGYLQPERLKQAMRLAKVQPVSSP